jgi:hypothetical protein
MSIPSDEAMAKFLACPNDLYGGCGLEVMRARQAITGAGGPGRWRGAQPAR